jgi:hypothetical protein
MSAPGKSKSGAQKRKTQAEQDVKHEKLLEKMPKLTSMFQRLQPKDPQNTGASSSTSIAQPPPYPEQPEAEIEFRAPELEQDTASDSPTVPVATTEEQPESEKLQLFETDPAKWNVKDDNLKGYLANCVSVERNIQLHFPDSLREYPGLRNSVSQGRLASLSLLCIECDLVKSMSFDDVIDHFSHVKSRKRAM